MVGTSPFHLGRAGKLEAPGGVCEFPSAPHVNYLAVCNF